MLKTDESKKKVESELSIYDLCIIMLTEMLRKNLINIIDVIDYSERMQDAPELLRIQIEMH